MFQNVYTHGRSSRRKAGGSRHGHPRDSTVTSKTDLLQSFLVLNKFFFQQQKILDSLELQQPKLAH